MRSRFSEVGVRAEGVRDSGGRTKGDGGINGAEVVALDFLSSGLQE